jgi:2-polyprenyl-3-methyl-5-hydroxy-6-metoxy-1,4-benzoquinol methylase
MPPLDQAKAEQFAQTMLDVLNDAFLALMTSIGHQTSLFEVMADLPPATSAEIGRAAGLQERYVREWLAAMVVGRVIDYDPAQRTYTLPPEHAASLTRRAGSGNLATLMQFVACMGSVEQGIVECFRLGGGLPYSAYTRFHQIQASSSGQTFDETLLDRTLPAIPGLMDCLAAGIDVLDVGCGSGHAINLMARRFPQSRFTGYDFSAEAIAAARHEASSWGLSNTRFEVQDAAVLSESEGYDFITTFDTIHDQAQPAQVLGAIARALRPDGTYLMVDIDASSELEHNLSHLLAPFLYAVSTMHCMSVSLGLNGTGLGTMWGEQQARHMLAQAGFSRVEIHRIQGDSFNSYYIAQKQ